MGVVYEMTRLFCLIWCGCLVSLVLCGDYDGVADWAQPYPTNTTTGWYHYYGDFRASVRVDEDFDAVQVKLIWRRRDQNPTNCSVQVIFPYELGQSPIQNVVLKETSRESTIVVFQPLYGPGEYHIYYMPYEGEGGTGLWVQVDYDPYFVTAENDWVQTYVNNNAYKTLPSATFVQFQSRTSFGRFSSMEFIALQSEVDSVIAKSQGAPYVLFPENRKNPLKMRDFLPMRWGQQGPSTQFSGTARQGEFYVFQIGVFAITQNVTINNVTFQDLKDSKGAVLVPGKTFKCWNFGGIDYLGNPFSQTWTVPQGTVNSIWCGFQIPGSAVKGQTYTTTAKVNVVPSSTVKVSITISQSGALANKGQDDIWRLSRLEWLDSTLGRDDSPVPPYTPLQVDNGVIYILGKKILIGDTGFTENIGINGNSITNGPIQLDTFAGGNQLEWNIIQSTTFEYATSTSARWNATIRTFDGSIQAVVRAECFFDGYVNYSVSITALKNILLDDIQLSTSISDYASLYMAGMGYQGGYRSRQGALAWNWIPGDSSNMVWFGNFDAGIRIKLKGIGAAWEGPYFMYDDIPDSWANGGLGGCVIDNEPTLVAYSGTRNMTKGMTVIFNYDLMMTPVKPLDNDHWNQRYYQMGYPGNDYHGIDEVKNVGATIVNVHQGVNSWINPNINYPFRPLVVDTLSNYSQWGKDEGIKVKFYYTVRELSNYAEELWALRTLGHEIYLGGDGHGPAGGSQGSHWIREHIEEDYQSCWQTVMANGDFDAAICDSGVGRWVNFYIEGLKASVEDPVGIDGVYCDGIAFPRDTMLRVRRVLNNIRPGTKKLIDLHSGDMFISWGNAMTAASYMHLFPFIDSLWFGEMFNYSQSYDYWLVAVAGIPYGLYGEILGEGNPWYGMVFGMTQRYLPGWIDPTPMWQFWDYFGINSSELVGWWDPNCPVTTTDENVKASVYQKSNEALIAIGNWNTRDVQVELYIDWGALGFDKTKCVLVAEAISGFQDQSIFLPDQLIPTEAQQGWVLIVRAASTIQELKLIQSRT